MNASLHYSSEDTDWARMISNLKSEVDRYRKESETLMQVNTLHQRMAGILDLPTMIETYSIWLMEHVEHDLVGFNNPGHQRMHMFCSSHGPQRRQAIKLTELLLKRFDRYPTAEQIDNFHACKWTIQRDEACEGLAFIRRNAPFSNGEIEVIEDTLPVLADSLRRAMEFEDIFSQIRKDSLTGLPNRVVFEERIHSYIEQARRHGHPLTLAALDLDHFKAVNDSMGHLKGDKVLKKVSQVMHEQIRQTDLLVRMGGDEFFLILPDTSIGKADYLAQRLCTAVRELNIQTDAGQLGVSIGLAQWEPTLSLTKWMEIADDRLYQAKSAGKSQVLY